jgi:hypothetical protein
MASSTCSTESQSYSPPYPDVQQPIAALALIGHIPDNIPSHIRTWKRILQVFLKFIVHFWYKKDFSLILTVVVLVLV